MAVSTTLKFLVLNGPNLNLLGTREPEIYGSETLAQVNDNLQNKFQSSDIVLRFEQSNSEGQLIEHIQDAMQWANGIIFNPGGYSHSSIALRDAVSGSNLPCVEVHLSNIHAREEFRQFSYISGVAQGVICGFGKLGYEMAVHALMHKLRN